jgi:hypothetical protein
MRARSKLTELDDVIFYNQSTLEVAQRALRESSQDSTEGDRENAALINALGTKETRGHVCDVSTKVTWKEGFLEHTHLATGSGK